MATTKISPNVWAIDQKEGGRVRAFLYRWGMDNKIFPNSKFILFDCMADKNPARIEDGIMRAGQLAERWESVTDIMLSHAHPSHLAGLAVAAVRSGAAVWAHPWEIDIVAGKKPMQKVGWKKPEPWNWEVVLKQTGLNLGLGKFEKVQHLQPLKDAQTHRGVVAVHTPGHTPGHMSFWIPTEGVLIAGDTICTWPSLDQGWNSFNLDPEETRKSVEKLRELPDVKVVGVGHGAPYVGSTKYMFQEILKK